MDDLHRGLEPERLLQCEIGKKILLVFVHEISRVCCLAGGGELSEEYSDLSGRDERLAAWARSSCVSNEERRPAGPLMENTFPHPADAGMQIFFRRTIRKRWRRWEEKFRDVCASCQREADKSGK